MLDMLELLGPSGKDFHTSIVFSYAFDFTLYATASSDGR